MPRDLADHARVSALESPSDLPPTPTYKWIRYPNAVIASLQSSKQRDFAHRVLGRQLLLVQAGRYAQPEELLGPGQAERRKGFVGEHQAKEHVVGGEKEAWLTGNFGDAEPVSGTPR